MSISQNEMFELHYDLQKSTILANKLNNEKNIQAAEKFRKNYKPALNWLFFLGSKFEHILVKVIHFIQTIFFA